MGLNAAYAKSALEFTLSANGIPYVQNHTGRVARAFFKFETSIGGGKELIALSSVGFIFCKRERFFYFFFMYGLYGIIVGYYKLAYANPRPYMISMNIKPFSCSKAFGNPSGHSEASSVFAIGLFLD